MTARIGRLLPKNIEKLGKLSGGNTKKQLPTNWVEFASLCKIRSKDKIVNFVPYEYQRILISLIEKHPTTVIGKTRQLGITEVVANYFLFKACHNPGYLGVIFSKGQEDTSNIARRIRRQIEGLYEYIEPKTDSLVNIELINGGRISFRNSSPHGARGLESVSDILYDEAAFVEDIGEIYASSQPCTATLGDAARIIIASTPDGKSGWYWEKLSSNDGERDIERICEQIKTQQIDPIQHWINEDGWCKYLVHWLAHPEFSLQKDNYLSGIQKRTGLPMEKVEQEYNLSFSHSETVIFPTELVRSNATGEWEKDPEDGEIYYMGLDTSLLGNDYTVLTILKQVEDKYHLVKMYRKLKQTHESNIYNLAELIELFNPVAVAIEINSSGQIYYERLTSQCPSIRFIPVRTTGQSKPIMINKLVLAMEKGKLIYPNDRIIIDEFLSFRENGTKLEAITGKHDDVVMSLAIAFVAISF